MKCFKVGPSRLYEGVKEDLIEAVDLGIPSISHRSQQFQDIYSKCTNGLLDLMNIPKSHSIFFLASATEGMERSIQNCVENYSYHFINGAFSNKFYEIALNLGKSAEKYEVDFSQDFGQIQNLNVFDESEMLCFVHNESSTGVAIELDGIYEISNLYPEKLISLDIVSSVPDVEIDFTKLDCVFFSVQKCFGLPAGLGVMIVSPRGIEKSRNLNERGVSTGSFHNFVNLHKNSQKNQTYETPNVMNIYLLGEVLENMLGKGISKIREEITNKATLLYRFADGSDKFSVFANNIESRSRTVIVLDTKGVSSLSYIHKLKNDGFEVSSGYGDYKDSHIRIANFPSSSVDEVEELIAVLRTL